jgi:4-hydroxybenzoate polyprenyltransferase
LAAIGARIFGMSFNRIFDRRLDALNPRTAGRDLPSGRLALRAALAVAVGGLLVYLAACAALGGWCLRLAPLPLVPLLGYSLLKRFTALCHFGIGLCLALAPLGAFVAADGSPNFTSSAVFFALFVFCWLSGSDIIYALMDLESDRLTGVHSLPARLGAQGALFVAALCHTVAFGCLTAVLLLTGGRAPAALALAASGLAMAAMYLPSIPLGIRFFPVSTIAGIAGALVPILGHFP